MGLREEEEEEKEKQLIEIKNCESGIVIEKVIGQFCGLSFDGKGLLLNIYLIRDIYRRNND